MKAPDNQLIIVNERDEWLGTMDKMLAHRDAVLHRALSIFVLNNKNELLLQQRALTKYHSGGLWSNTCCSHPSPGESTLAAAHRRLKEEMGFDCELEQVFTLRYKADVGNDLVENEYDHIFLGNYNGAISPNAEEANDYKFMSLTDIKEWMQQEPETFTPWFHLAIPKLLDYLQRQDKAA